MNVNCAIFERIYDIISEYTIGIITEDAKKDLIDAILYDMDCFFTDEDCIKINKC